MYSSLAASLGVTLGCSQVFGLLQVTSEMGGPVQPPRAPCFHGPSRSLTASSEPDRPVCDRAAELGDTDTEHAAGAERSRVVVVGELLNRPKKREGKREVRDAGAALRGTPQFVSAFTVNNSPAARLSAHLTALLRGNHKDYVSIMLAVRCLLFAAVCARCAVTGRRLSFLILTFHFWRSACTQRGVYVHYYISVMTGTVCCCMISTSSSSSPAV